MVVVLVLCLLTCLGYAAYVRMERAEEWLVVDEV